jgi:hypothetical protein
MRKSLPAAAVALTLLAGCAHSSDTKNVASTTPGTAASSPSLPPMFVPPPGSSGAAASPGATTAAAAGDGGTTGGTTGGAPGTKAPRRLTPGIQALGTTWIDAKVTRTGPGSCVGLTSTDGTAYAVYLTQSVRLTPGTKLRAKINPGKTPINCGKGHPARSDRVQIAD